MRMKTRQKMSRFFSLLLVVNLLLSVLVTADVLYPSSSGKVYAAESSAIGTGNYSTGVSGGATLTAGTTYTFGGKSWIAAEVGSGYAVLQSTGLTGGAWPGYAMSGTLTNAAGSTITLTGANSYYTGNIDGYDISKYNSTTQSLYNSIKAAEYTSATYGKGLYLVSNAKCNQTTAGNQGSGNYWTALKSAAANYSSFGASNYYAWLGTVYGSNNAWYVSSSGDVFSGDNQYYSYVLAPAFNLDLSKVRLSGTTLEIATFQDSTGIEATQSITSVEEGATTDLASIITAVKYVGGDNAGKSASYKISTNDGSISGTNWTAPTGINTNKSVELTITEQTSGKKFSTKKTVTVTPKAAKSITVEQKQGFPASMKSGESIDLASYITVTGYDQNSESDGVLGAYTLSSDGGTFDGTVFTAGKVTTTKDVVINVTGNGALGSVSYVGKTATFKIKVKPDTTGWTDRDEDVDEKGFHTYVDDSTDITWKYKYDDNGNINYLYTESNVTQIISDGNVLLVPSTISGVPVVGIGGGDKDGDTIPFIPTSGGNKNSTWTSIYFPASVKTINDGAFLLNDASANIVIPGTIKKVGVCAFKGSGIKSVIFNDAESLTISSEAFADIPTLEEAVFRGNGVTICERAFSNATGLTSLTIPNGTKFKGETNQNDSFAFQGTTGLEIIKIDTDQVYSNTFSANKNLKKVIFGENVSKVKYDWSGTAASNSETCAETVARTTYSLNAETVFEMDKTSGGSPFGYANALTVIGKNKDINGDSYAYNNTTDPVTAKIAYLATYYQTNNEVKGYAKGTGASVTITAEEDPADNSGVTSTETPDQTGIEAYYNGIIFTGKQLEKSKMTVYKMFGNKQNGKYEVSDFYVLRTTDADTLLNKQTTDYQAGGVFVADQYSDNKNIIESFEGKDSITINSADLEAGTVDVKIIVLLKDNDGHVLVNDEARKVIAYSYTVAIPVKEYTAEEDFFENYGSYSKVISTINDLNKKIDAWEEKIAELTGLNGSAMDDIDLVKEELDKKQNELQTYIQMYNALTLELKDLTENTNIDSTGYIGTVDGKEIVYVNGQELIATATGEKYNGNDLYTSTGDVGSGQQLLEYYVDADGVHIIKVDGVTISPELVYSDSIKALERKLTAQVTQLRKELNGYDGVVTDFKSLLNITETNFDTLTGAEQLGIVYTYVQANVNELDDIDKALDDLYSALQYATGSILKSKENTGSEETAADKINSITAMVQQLSDSYNANNSYLRENICEINLAYGYGHYVKYNDKYVFVIYENDSFVYYIKTSESARQYLLTADGGVTFEEASEAEASSLAAAYDSVTGSKFMLLDDTTNGYDPYVSNPLATYKNAMASFIDGFNGYNEKTAALIAALNTINGKSQGDDGYIAIPDETDADSINTALGSALESVKTKLNALELQRATYSSNMAGIAKILDEYLAGDYSGATELSDEEAAAVLLAVQNAYADLDLLRGQMSDVNDALSDLYNALFKAFGDMGIETNQDTGKARGEETTADKIESITGMVNQITASYNALKEDYDSLKTDYQKVIDSIYGEDEKTVDQVTSQQIINQINKNQQDAITAAVNEALENADNFETHSAAVQQSIAVVIDDILDGKTVDTSTLDPALQTQLEEVKNMKAEIDGMQNGSDAYASFLETLRSALSLDDTADAAKILESIQSLKDQVATLTSQLNTKTTTISKIQAKLSTTADGDDLVALVGTGTGDTTAAYNKGYNAGYAAGKAENSNSSSNNNSNYQTGYTTGYNAGYVAGSQSSGNNSTATVQIASLTSQVSSLTKENATLEAKVDTLSSENKTLESDKKSLQSENETLSEENTTLSSANKALQSKNKSLSTKNTELKEKVSTLTSTNSSLNKKVTSLNNQISSLKSKATGSGSGTGDTTAAYNNGFDAGYAAGQKTSSNAGNSDSNSSDTVSLKQNEPGSTDSSAVENEDDSIAADDNNEDTEQENSVGIFASVNQNQNRKTINLPPTGSVDLPDNVKVEGFESNSAYIANVTSNCLSVNDTLSEAKEHANIIFNYFASNLSRLSELGSSQIEQALSDGNKEVDLSAILSVDVLPTEEQKVLMNEGKPVEVTLFSNDFVDGVEYLVVHESTVRADSYDTILVTAKNSSLTMELEDLSPISVARISVKDPVTADSGIAGNTNEIKAANSSANKKDNSGLKNIFIALVLVAGLGIVGILIYKNMTTYKKGKPSVKRS